MIKTGRSIDQPLTKIDDWFDLLTCSIVRQAVEDFRFYMRRLEEQTTVFKILRYKAEIQAVLRFIDSQWYEDISPINRSVLKAQLRQEVMEFIKKHKKHKGFYEREILHGLER